jgi:hypothetical protein
MPFMRQIAMASRYFRRRTIALFGVTVDTNRRQSMRALCAWQERRHVRLARIERAIEGKAVREESRGTYAKLWARSLTR